jgi:hypothetical protein
MLGRLAQDDPGWLRAEREYQRTSSLDLGNNPNLQKIAVYATRQPDGTIKEITHAALQEADGSWASKLGHLPLIRHADPYAVDGPMYGVPVATYVRDAGNRVNAPTGNKGPAQNGSGTLARQSGGAKNTNAFSGAIRQAGAKIGGRSADNGGFASFTWNSSDGSRPNGLGPVASAAVQACGADVTLRRQIEAMLQAHAAPDSFLEKPAAAMGPTIDDPRTPDETEAPGTRVGPYKLLQQVGEGGMGTVWMAVATPSYCPHALA